MTRLTELERRILAGLFERGDHFIGASEVEAKNTLLSRELVEVFEAQIEIGQHRSAFVEGWRITALGCAALAQARNDGGSDA